MSFFASIFQRIMAPPSQGNEQDAPPLDPLVVEEAVATLKIFCDDVRRMCPEAFADNGSGLTALSAYAYGGLLVLSGQRRCCPAHARVIFRELLIQVAHFTLRRSLGLSYRCHARMALSALHAKSSFRGPVVTTPLGRTWPGRYLASVARPWSLQRSQFNLLMSAAPHGLRGGPPDDRFNAAIVLATLRRCFDQTGRAQFRDTGTHR